MTVAGFFVVGGGAALGAWLRWWLGILLNPVFAAVPFGTLAANLVGGLLMGIAMELLSHYDALSPETRLLITTGFLGGLTTFSTFSAEVSTLILRAEWGWTAALVALHVLGSVALTLAGIAITKLALG